MNFKNFLFSLSFLFFAITAFSQEYKTNIKTEFSDYLNFLATGDYEKSMNYITDEYFEIVSREQMISLLEQTFNNPEIEIEIKDSGVLNVKDSELIEGKHYSLVRYSTVMDMRFNLSEEEKEEDTEEDKKLRTNLMFLSLKNMFGSNNVSYNEETDFFTISAEKEAYAVSENGKTGWKFIVVEEKQHLILEKILPQELVDRI